ncbi:MAG: T9SS type A sorting domain-containing protein, partial [Candidatus Heimdallarchaeota archaeon]|nr:T9SS type A sorting domain-containing protein [Candidatus Heimdallarchaeota archaeon]
LTICNPGPEAAGMLESQVYNNAGNGVEVRNCLYNINRSDIYNNQGYGYVNMGTAPSWINGTSDIYENMFSEVIAIYDCFPDFTSDIWGNPSVVDEESSSDLMDQYLLAALGPISSPIHVEELIVSTEDTTRFFPNYSSFIFEEPSNIQANTLYREGMSHIENKDYVLAYDIMILIINDYPEAAVAKKALSLLPYLNKAINGNSYALIAYIEQIQSANLEDNKVEAIAISLMTVNEYNEAISLLESIIDNPPNNTKQLLAELDEAYCYYKLVSSGYRNLPEICHHKPTNLTDYFKIRQNIHAQLLYQERGDHQNTIPEVVTLHHNYPNPFNPNTTISFSIPDADKVNISIFNIKGQLVRTLVDKNYERGIHEVLWNGRDDSGRSVSSGLYLYKLKVNGKSESVKKMLLLK